MVVAAPVVVSWSVVVQTPETLVDAEPTGAPLPERERALAAAVPAAVN